MGFDSKPGVFFLCAAATIMCFEDFYPTGEFQAVLVTRGRLKMAARTCSMKTLMMMMMTTLVMMIVMFRLT